MPDVLVGSKRLALSNLDKVLYPAADFTKAAVIDYYRNIAPLMLPHLAGHPVSLKRVPDGVEGEAFFEKRCPAQHPPWVRSVPIASSRFGSIDYCVVDNLPTLLWLANRAALELHLYLFRVPREDAPTCMVFDLDPGAPAGLAECLPLALELRQLLTEVGLECLPKGSGGKGLHVYVPLSGSDGFAATKAFALAVARLLEQRHPDRVTTVMAKKARPGKIFIDWSQNDHGKTTISPYSLRVRERPTVSAPLAWNEIERAHRRSRAEDLVFEAGEMAKRIARTGDLFA